MASVIEVLSIILCPLLGQSSVVDETVLDQFSIEDEVLQELKSIGAVEKREIEMIEDYLRVGEGGGFDGFIIDSIFMTNLRRRLTDGDESNPFGRLVRQGKKLDNESSEESEKGDESKRSEEVQEKKEEEQTLEEKKKEEEIKKLDEEIIKDSEIYKTKKNLESPNNVQLWEKIQNWLRLLALDFSCNLVVGKNRHGTSNFLEIIKGNFLTDVIKSTEAEFINGTYRGNRRDFLWKLVSENTEDILLDRVIKVFVAAMTLTVSANLTWFFHLISFHTNFQRRMDIDGIDEWKNHSLLNNLSYLEACVSEAIRLQGRSKTRENQTVISPQLFSKETIENQRKKSKIKNDSGMAVREEKTMQEKEEEFIPGRWVDGTGCFVGLSGKEEELYNPWVKKIVHIAVKCVAIEVLSKIKVIDIGEEKMKMKWINIEKRNAKSRMIQKKKTQEKLRKEIVELKNHSK